MNPRLLCSLVFALTGLGLASGLAAPQPNILFLLADDQRADTISALGNPRIDTPNLDALVERGMSFPRAVCSYPICVVSRAEIMTGRHGWENGVDGLTNKFQEDKVTFWAQTLRDAGYATGYVGKWHTSGRPLSRGYAEVHGLFSGGGGKYWEDQADWKGTPVTGYRGWIFQSEDGKEKYPELGLGLTPDISSKFADAAIEFLEARKGQETPWFLHVNFTAPHDPLFMPPGLEGKYQAEAMELPANFAPQHPFDHGNLHGRDEELLPFPRTPGMIKDLLRVYYSVIDDLDHQVGRILDTLETGGMAGNTIVIYSSDHGLSVGSHGLRGKQNMYEPTNNVPLIIAGPGIPKGKTSPAQVYLRELYPTTCELVGVPVPGAVTAQSFAPVLRGETETHHEAIFGYFTDAQRMIRAGGWKLILYPQAQRSQLFDLKSDPNELHDLSGDLAQKPRYEELRDRLERWRREQGDPILSR